MASTDLLQQRRRLLNKNWSATKPAALKQVFEASLSTLTFLWYCKVKLLLNNIVFPFYSVQICKQIYSTYHLYFLASWQQHLSAQQEMPLVLIFVYSGSYGEMYLHKTVMSPLLSWADGHTNGTAEEPWLWPATHVEFLANISRTCLVLHLSLLSTLFSLEAK